MIELCNSKFDEKVASLFLTLRSSLGNNLIKVEGERVNQKIKIYVYKKIDLHDIEILSVEDLIKEALSSIPGINFQIDHNNITIKVETLNPTVYEEISVKLYEIERTVGIKLNVTYLT